MGFRRQAENEDLYSIAGSEALLNDWREICNLSCPLCFVGLLEALKQSLEHAIELRRGYIPLYDGIAEPEQTLQNRVSIGRRYEIIDVNLP